MAISQSEYTFLSILAQLSVFPENPTILEFGEQHWHGDVSLDDVKQDIDVFLPEQAQKVRQELSQLMQREDNQKNFDMAKIVYRLFFDYQTLTAIDLHGTEHSLPLDLNHEISLDQNLMSLLTLVRESMFLMFISFSNPSMTIQSQGA